jgi:hypothetical protein
MLPLVVVTLHALTRLHDARPFIQNDRVILLWASALSYLYVDIRWLRPDKSHLVQHSQIVIFDVVLVQEERYSCQRHVDAEVENKK